MLNLSFFIKRRVPLILQSEAAECGLACLAMIAEFWGQQNDLAALRRKFRISLRGITLKSIVRIASSLGLRVRPLKIDVPLLDELKLPAILHWNFNHFVVLKEIKSGYVYVNDPAIGERRLTMNQLSAHFSGVALEVSRDSNFSSNKRKENLSLFSLMGRITGLRKSISLALGLGLALQVTMLVAPFYLQWIVDDVIAGNDRSLLTVLGVAFVVLVCLQTFISSLRAWLVTTVSAEVSFQWMVNVYAHLMRLPFSFFEMRHAGDIISRFSSIKTIQQSLTTKFVESIIDGILVCATLSLMFFYSPGTASVSVVAATLYALLRTALAHRLREATAEQILHTARQQTHFLESVRGVQSIRLFGKTQDRQSSWMNTLADQVNAELHVARVTVLLQNASLFVTSLERVAVVWILAGLALDSKFTIGMLFAYMSYQEQFSQRMSALIDKFFDWKMLLVHGERVADIVLSDPEDSLPGQIPIEEGASDLTLEVRDVSFRYADDEPYVIERISFKVAFGESVALTGASGSGKTTLFKILLGLLRPTKGEILIGNIPVSRFGLERYREIIGTVMQDDTLFSGSVADNISFFDASPDVPRIYESARAAAIHSELMHMPMGYETIIGNIGSGLSGGQQQRILLARALYKQPKILLLDEATSALDIDNEKIVNRVVSNLELTRIFIAHRPETIATAHRVIEISPHGIISDKRRGCEEGSLR